MSCCCCLATSRIEPKAVGIRGSATRKGKLSQVDTSPDQKKEAQLNYISEADKAHPDNEPIQVAPDFGGPCKNRRCTDVLCLLLLIACWFAMTFIGLATIPGSGIETSRLNKGNPWRLINGQSGSVLSANQSPTISNGP